MNGVISSGIGLLWLSMKMRSQDTQRKPSSLTNCFSVGIGIFMGSGFALDAITEIFLIVVGLLIVYHVILLPLKLGAVMTGAGAAIGITTLVTMLIGLPLLLTASFRIYKFEQNKSWEL